jgi:hypothetical protein
VAFEDRVNLLFLEQGNVFLRLFAKRKKKLRPQQCTMTQQQNWSAAQDSVVEQKLQMRV